MTLGDGGAANIWLIAVYIKVPIVLQAPHACVGSAPVPQLMYSRAVVCADDLSSEDGGSPAAVKGLSGLSVSDPGQEVPKKAG